MLCLQRTQQIPLEAAVNPSDPRPNSGHGSRQEFTSQKLPLALPSFALLPAKVAETEDSDGYSWSEAPYEVVQDDAVSAGEFYTVSTECDPTACQGLADHCEPELIYSNSDWMYPADLLSWMEDCKPAISHLC